MKQIVSNYSYSPTTNVVTLTGVNIEQDQLLLVVAPQVGRTMYNFASGVTGAVSAGADTRLILNASTVGLTTTSPLVIYYDDQASTQTIAGTVTANVSAIYASESNFDTTQSPLIVAGGVIGGNEAQPLRLDSNANLRVSVNNSVTIGSLPAISGTVTANASNGSLTTRFGTPTTANTAFATSAVTNANRKYLLIQNVTTGSNVITVGIGFTPTTTQGIQLTAGAGITFESSYIPTGAVYVLSSVTASNFTILEA